MAETKIKLGIDGVQTVVAGMKQVTEKVGDLSGAMTTLSTIGGSLSLGAFAALVKSSIDAADNLNDLSKKTSLAVDISADEARYLLKNDVDRVCTQLDAALPWWRTMSERRQRVLANMCFNMGIGNSMRGLLSFRNTLASMQRGDYRAAARGMRDSAWAKQVGARSERLAKMMEEG